MYTQCPQCETVFRIKADELALARGAVRCGVCQQGFNALARLSERLDVFSNTANRATAVEDRTVTDGAADTPDGADHTAPPPIEGGPAVVAGAWHASSDGRSSPDVSRAATPAQAAVHATTAPAGDETGPTDRPTRRVAGERDGYAAFTPPAPDTTLADNLTVIKPFSATGHERLGAPWVDVGSARREPTVSSLSSEESLSPITIEARHDIEPQGRRGGWFKTLSWTVTNLALIVLLVGQYAVFNREALAQYPELRPWLSAVCGAVGCDVPLRKDVSRIALANRVVQSHPGQEHALLIDATLINEADFTQPYPVVELRFSDLKNHLVAGRRFRPYEYLPDGINIKKGMPPREPLRFSLEISDPGKEAVSFQFNLL